MAVELFGNFPTATVSSGGATSPSSGTTETWTVNAIGSFPVVSNTTTPPTYFHIADPLLPTELIKVTNTGGAGNTTWTVVRGDENTSTISHSTNFTVRQVVSAGTLTSYTTAQPGLVSQQTYLTQRSVALTPWFAGLANRETARCNVACIGDSITEGQAAVGPPDTGFTNKWVSRLVDQLRNKYPTQGFTGGGRGYINTKGTGVVSFTWPTTITGSLGATTSGPKNGAIQFNTTGQNIVYNLTGDNVDIMWQQVAFGGTFSYQVDAGSVVNQSTNGGGTVDGKLTRVSLGSAGAHTLTLAWVSGNANVDGVIEYNGDASQGIQVHDCGHFGWQTSNWTSALVSATAGSAAAIAALSPSLIIITLGVNDQFAGVLPSTFQTNLQTIISDMKAALTSPYPSFVLNMLPPRTGQSGYTFPWSQYVNAAYNVAAADTSGPGGVSIVTVMDWTLGPRMPGADSDVYNFWKAADLVHPSNLGHQALADGLVSFLSQV